MTSGGNNFNHFAENQLTKFSDRDAGDFSDAAGEVPKCGSLPRDAGDLVGLRLGVVVIVVVVVVGMLLLLDPLRT